MRNCFPHISISRVIMRSLIWPVHQTFIQDRPWACVGVFPNLPNQPRHLGPKAKSSLFVWNTDYQFALLVPEHSITSIAVLNCRHHFKLESRWHKAVALVSQIHTCIQLGEKHVWKVKLRSYWAKHMPLFVQKPNSCLTQHSGLVSVSSLAVMKW